MLCATRAIEGVFLLIASSKQSRHVADSRVEDAEHELRYDPDGEHEQRYGNDDELFAPREINNLIALLGQRTTEQRLHCAHKNDRGKEKPKNRDCSVGSGDSERAFENQKFSNEPI